MSSKTSTSSVDLEILIPVDDNGHYDVNKQKEIVIRYKKLEEIQRNLTKCLEKLGETKVTFD